MAAQPKAQPMNLTQVAYVLRRVILFGGFGIVFLMVGRIFFSSAYSFYKTLYPDPPPPPTVGFGVLPKIEFPQSASVPQSYKLEIPPSRTKLTTDRMFVFFVPSKRASLLALEKAQTQAGSLGFLFEPERVTSEQYRWRRNQPLPSVLDYNIITGTFTMTLNWQSNPGFLQEKRLPKEDTAIDILRQTLSSAGLMYTDMATGSAKITYLRASGTSYATTVSLSEADFLQVDLFRTPVYGQYQIVTPKPDQGTIRAIITPQTDKNQQIALMEFKYLPVDYTSVHTYPIISPMDAYNLLAGGKGYVARGADGQAQAIIRDVRLAYFDSGVQQQYLQPIYVFEGDGGFVGYIPAIDPKFLVQ